MQAILIFLGVSLVLVLPLGLVLGFVAFLRSNSNFSRIAVLERKVAELHGQIASLKQPRVAEPATQPAQPAERAPNPVSQHIPKPRPLTEPRSNEPPHSASQPPTLGPKTSPSRLRQALQDNWMVWLGGLSVALAGIFMVSHSISAGLIGPVQQLLLAIITGVALYAGAEFLRRRHQSADPVFAALAGGGSVTLYAAVLAGIHHFELISPIAGLVGLAGISLVTLALALLHGPLLAAMGLTGAYAVPLLIGAETDSAAFVLFYSLLITLSSMMLMRYVFRRWLWYATLAGALIWWSVTAATVPVDMATAGYLAALFVLFSLLPARHQTPWRLCAAFLPLLALWGLSIAHQPVDQPSLWGWLLILPAASLVAPSRSSLWFLSWGAVLATAGGWLLHRTQTAGGPFSLLPFPPDLQTAFSSYLMTAALMTTGLGLWRWRQYPHQRRWASLTLLSPLVWVALGWLLLHGQSETSLGWAVGTLLLGVFYAALAWRLEGKPRYHSSMVWALMATHVSYSLAMVMTFQQASLTLALSVQFVSLTWLARRYQMPELHWLLKGVLALVIARLTFNPWLRGYDASVHWSLWTYGGSALLAAVATRLADKNHSIRAWLEGATLHLLVLFLGTEMRYWLYDGDIFIHEYGLTEATMNTLLWGALSVTYAVRAKVSQSLAWLYRLFSWGLLTLSSMSYLALVTLHNPWWSDEAISSTPVFNMLLPAFAGPVLLWLVISRFPEMVPRFTSRCVAGAGFLLFTALEIRQLWQGSDMALGDGMTEGELYTYSVVGLLYALGAIVYSTLYSPQRPRTVLYKTGMTLLGAVIGKIFLIDMAGLQGFWRVAAFMGLGLALLGLAWLYRRVQRSNAQTP